MNLTQRLYSRRTLLVGAVFLITSTLSAIIILDTSGYEVSDVSAHPFLKVGAPIDSGKVKSISESEVRLYKEAMARFPKFDNCIEEPKDIAASKLRWEKIGSAEDLEVCLFLIASAMKDTGLLLDWLAVNNFSDLDERSIEEAEMSFYEVDEAGLQTRAILRDQAMPSSIAGVTPFFRPRNISISIVTGKNVEVLDVNIGLTWE